MSAGCEPDRAPRWSVESRAPRLSSAAKVYSTVDRGHCRPRSTFDSVTRSCDLEVTVVTHVHKHLSYLSTDQMTHIHSHIRYQAKTITLNYLSHTLSALRCYCFYSIVNYLCSLLRYCNLSTHVDIPLNLFSIYFPVPYSPKTSVCDF